MIIGIGNDIVLIERFENKEPHFYEKIFTKSEIEYIEKKQYRSNTVAGLYAAKEALLKALGTGIGRGFWLTDVEILHDEQNAPYYVNTQKIVSYIAGKSQNNNNDKNINMKLSISHDKLYASAFAIIEVLT